MLKRISLITLVFASLAFTVSCKSAKKADPGAPVGGTEVLKR